MRIDMQFQGMDELVKALEKCASESEIQALNKKIVTQAEPIIKNEMNSRIPKSDDVSKSGRGFGSLSSVSSHSADEIPVGKVKVKATGAEADVGWTKADNSPHFYVKFINWGTIYRTPHEFIYAAGQAASGQVQNIAEREYQNYLSRTVG